MTEWLTVAAAGIATYAMRALPLVAAFRPGERTRAYLDDLPVSVIAALAGAGVLAPEQRLALGPELVAAPVVIAVAWWRRNLLLAVLAGIAATAALRAVL